MTEVNGWHLPGHDNYFAPFLKGPIPKQNGFQREHLLKAFHHVRAWHVAIDVGAYVGFWTLDMAERFEQVFAFEPCHDSFECLCRNMAEHPNVATARAAVGDRSGVCSMVYDPLKNTGSRFVNPKGKGVPMMALDDLKFETCDLLKIDVEGFEPMVLKGAQKLLKRFRPVVIMETDKRFGARFGMSNAEAYRTILRMGYREAQYLDDQGKNALRPDRIFIPR